MIRSVLFYIATFALLAGTAVGETPTISLDEAQKLVQLGLPSRAQKLPGLSLVPDNCPKPPCRCRTFDILWSNPAGSPHYDFFTVDLRTGEVRISLLCKRVTNHALSKAQRAIRKRLGVSESEYRQSLKSPPVGCCMGP